MSTPKKVAIVVQRCHPRALGGSEALALQYAQLLQNHCDVDILTSCAINAMSWESELEPGISELENFRIQRFPNQIGHTPYWQRLHTKLVQDYQNLIQQPGVDGHARPFLNWPHSLQKEWVRAQGPHSPALLSYLALHSDTYDHFIFLTYLYSPTCLGLPLVARAKAILVPTLHDEPPARLEIFNLLAHSASQIFWNTHTEKKFGESLWGKLPGRILAMYVNTEIYTQKPIIQEPYYLYLGRIEEGKGCKDMIAMFLESIAALNQKPKLILAGKLEMGLPRHPQIQYRGFVSEDEKFNLIRHANALIMPSVNESLSIVTLEAMAQMTPVILNQKNPVLVEHHDLADSGFLYKDTHSFSQAINQTVQQIPSASWEKGRAYTLNHFSRKIIAERLLDALAACRT